MNQPKFKFGDKVTGKGEETPWEIRGFRKLVNDEEYRYIRSEMHISYIESELELYQEPQEKKPGMLITLSHEHPAIIKVGDREIHLFKHKTPSSGNKLRVVCDRDIKIDLPNFVRATRNS